jgi:hypothetical protein
LRKIIGHHLPEVVFTELEQPVSLGRVEVFEPDVGWGDHLALLAAGGLVLDLADRLARHAQAGEYGDQGELGEGLHGYS